MGAFGSVQLMTSTDPVRTKIIQNFAKHTSGTPGIGSTGLRRLDHNGDIPGLLF